MNFEEFSPASTEGHVEAAHPELATHEPERETSVVTKPTSLFDRLSQSTWARSLALMAGTAIGGGSLTALSGCSMRDETQVMRTIEKEVKFSTFPADARVTLESMPTQLTSREALKKTVDELIVTVNKTVTTVEETHSCPYGVLKELLSNVAQAQKQIAAASQDINLAASQLKLNELAQSVAHISQLKQEDFATNVDSSAYQKLARLQGDLHDWSDALARDIDMINFGMHARDVATLAKGLEGTSQQLNTLIEIQTLSPEWFQTHPNELALVRAQLQLSVEQSTRYGDAKGFSEISHDLGDVTKLLKDVLQAIDASHQQEFFAKKPGQNTSTGQLLAKEASQLVDALRADLKKELSSTIGAEAPAGGQPKNVATVPATQPDTVQHHYHSSPDMLTWYLLMNRGGGYHGSYTYVPNQHYGYSGSSRFRSSPEYSSFSNTSHETHSVLGGKPGISSHAGTTAGGRSPSGSSTHIGSSSHTNHSSPIHHSGGFSGGKGFSSGFGG